ncbi:hypothetical protein GQ44DRAFT_754052 [Phaeosphaeriaceae sp. PMI808]|nr:hypothetical protein GQ44DRAFT_754052 [Phaeosphaeriaceae sp. PMI808]
MVKPTIDPAIPSPEDITKKFRKYWEISTDDNNLTLHGFRRFKTTHLLNLRFLESEVAELDHTIYQAGLSLGLAPSPTDRLGLKHSNRDANVLGANVPDANNAMTRDTRSTFSLLDDEKLSSIREDLTLYETYKTRLLRVDLGTRSRTDPFQRWLHRYLRTFRYWRLSRKSQNNREGLKSSVSGHRWSYQNTIFIADVIGRISTAAMTGTFLVVPLAVLSHELSKDTQLVVVSICIVVLSFLVSLFLKVSSFEMMAVSAAYAAVLSVFVSNVPVART